VETPRREGGEMERWQSSRSDASCEDCAHDCCLAPDAERASVSAPKSGAQIFMEREGSGTVQPRAPPRCRVVLRALRRDETTVGVL